MSISTERRIQIERSIIGQLVDVLLSRGYNISVDNGGDEYECRYSINRHEIIGSLMATDHDTIRYYEGTRRLGWFVLVYGNDGWDVVADHLNNKRTNSIMRALEDTIAMFEKESN